MFKSRAMPAEVGSESTGEASAPLVKVPPPASADEAEAAPSAPADPEPAPAQASEPRGLSLLGGDGQLSKEEARLALEALKQTVIMADMPDALPQRCILREAMTEYFLSVRFDDPDDWLKRIPMYLRQGTDPAQRKYLGQVCDVVQRQL